LDSVKERLWGWKSPQYGSGTKPHRESGAKSTKADDILRLDYRFHCKTVKYIRQSWTPHFRVLDSTLFVWTPHFDWTPRSIYCARCPPRRIISLVMEPRAGRTPFSTGRKTVARARADSTSKSSVTCNPSSSSYIITFHCHGHSHYTLHYGASPFLLHRLAISFPGTFIVTADRLPSLHPDDDYLSYRDRLNPDAASHL